MSRMSIATPCPAPYALSSLPVPNKTLRSVSGGGSQDDTADIDYTRALQVDFKNAKPRRKSTFQRPERKGAAVTMFEDVLEDEELVVDKRREVGGSTLLGKPAQRIPQNAIKTIPDVEPLQAIGQARKRLSLASQPTILESEPPQREMPAETENVSPGAPIIRGNLKKEPRRRTIFVPTDDTTMLTIHPGANTTDRLNDTFQLPGSSIPPAMLQQEARWQKAVDTRSQASRKARMSLAAAPKRVPLQQVVANDANFVSKDMAGQNGGKENSPPHQAVVLTKKENAQVSNPAHRVSLAHSRLFEPTAASQARTTIFARQAVPLSHTSSSTLERQPRNPRITMQQRATQDVRVPSNLRPSAPRVRNGVPSKYSPPSPCTPISPEQKPRPAERRVEGKQARLQQYPFLSEDLAQPELYEDGWLGHQEIALGELINHLFTTTRAKHNDDIQPLDGSLRERMIDIYHRPGVATLHKRIQASLLYGALSRPRDSFKPPDPAQDIGLRKRFLGLWLESYSNENLRAATEVVFGRRLDSGSIELTGQHDGDSLDPHQSRRALIGFLETFLVQVDDVQHTDEEQGDDTLARWRKMVQRSLMLIWLLDQAKISQRMAGCVFKRNSPRKSSVAMLQGLASLMIPSVGDVSRILPHLDYEVCHVQDPLDEVQYHIGNIAIDFRDGVLLTRLVELLLFSAARMRIADMKGDATVTVQMPDQTILESALCGVEEARCPRILSQHLKLPCLGRAQKVFNVQIAISALHGHGRLQEGAADVTADEIVDGHREKTLSLLWSLVSNHGLDELVDFKQLREDMKRSAVDPTDAQNLDDDGEYLSQLQQESLLKKWASTYCAKESICISNLTTSFADGTAYSAILDAFANFMPANCSKSTSASAHGRLKVQLQTFGCSTAFIKQLASTGASIPSRRTTISNLAFLASRLLPLAKQHNAAARIQRAYRLKRYRSVASQRIALMRMAHACAAVVRTHDSLVSAASTLQRAWRRVLDARIARLNRDALRFQAFAKSWLCRRRMHRTVGIYDAHLSRAMGGW